MRCSPAASRPRCFPWSPSLPRSPQSRPVPSSASPRRTSPTHSLTSSDVLLSLRGRQVAVCSHASISSSGQSRSLHTSQPAPSLSHATWERAQSSPHLLNLAIGQPALSLLPIESLQHAAQSLSKFDPRHLLQYGAAAGSQRYLTSVSSFLSDQLGYQCDPDSLFATPGNSGGLALATRALTHPGDTVFVEEPSYFLAHKIFKDSYCNFIPVPQYSDGTATIDIEAFRKLLWRERYLAGNVPNRPFPKFLYCVPTGNNPTGRTMPDDDRARLVGYCAEYGLRIVADDVYELLQWQMNEAPRPLRWHARQQGVESIVVSLGSWSKILGPGLRLGWIEADSKLRNFFATDGEVNSGSFTSPLVESMVSIMIENKSAHSHLQALRKALERRVLLLTDAVNQAVPSGIGPVVHPAPSGYFLWVDLKGIDASLLQEHCIGCHGVTFLPGPRCALQASAASTHARISFAFLEEDALYEAGSRLGRALSEKLT